MKQKNYNSCTVGQIVAGNFDTPKVFSRYHIDFCCHGNTPFAEADVYKRQCQTFLHSMLLPHL